MATDNFLKDIQQKRANFKNYAQKALDNNWITKEQFDEFLHKIENDKLVIGVIGQMKAGKSTFLNALIFKDEVLPAATTPMTASLSVLTYGEEKKLEAEFYTSQEWAELKQFASLDESNYEGDNNQLSKIKAAKEIISKSVTIENELNVLLGTKKADDFENLIEYVGADGKYIAITKSVHIEYPMEDLKGVEIVDTPGFNDPVVSREERTKDFLKKADVVIMLLYAGRAFDATDKDIIFNKVRSVGVGKLLIGVNKYDINYAQGETNEAMVSYVKEQLLKASEEHSNNSIAVLVKEQDPLLISANMALMSKMDITKISQDKDLDFYYKKALDDFEITTQKEMYEKSLMPAFEEAIREIILKSKDEILIQKPVNLIKQIGEDKKDKAKMKFEEISNKLKISEMPDDEKEEKMSFVSRAKKRIKRDIENFEVEINDTIENSYPDFEEKLKEKFITYKGKCLKRIDETSNWTSDSKIQADLNSQIELLEIEVSKDIKDFNKKINDKLKSDFESFFEKVQKIADKFLEDFEKNDYISNVRKLIGNKFIDIEFGDLLPSTGGGNSGSSVLISVFEGLLLGVAKLLRLGTLDKMEYRNQVEALFWKFDFEPIKKSYSSKQNELISKLKTNFFDDFLTPLEEELNKSLADKAEKEKEISNLKEELSKVKSYIAVIEPQIEEMKFLENSI